MFTCRLCEKTDCKTWIQLNRAFMAEEIQDDELWNNTDQVSDGQFAETFYSALEVPNMIRLLLFEEDGVPMGFANLMIIFSVWTHGKAMVVDDLYLDKLVRGKGYGRMAMEMIENLAKQCGCRRLQFQSEETNPGAMAFYMAVGYQPTDMKFYVKYLGGKH